MKDLAMMTLTDKLTLEAQLTPDQAEAVIGAVRHAADHDTPLRPTLLSTLGALYQAFDPMDAPVELDLVQADAVILAVHHAIDHDTSDRPLLAASLTALYEARSQS
jgi:hypothetical protein